MKLMPTFRETRLWLGEREALGAERKVLDLLRQARAEPGGALGWTPELQAMDDHNRARTAEVMATPARRLIWKFYNLYLKIPNAWQQRLRRGWQGPNAGLPPSRINRPALAVPFGPGFPPPAPSGPVAAVIHIFYPELAGELRAYLGNIPGTVDLYLSSDSEPKLKAIQAAFAGWDRGQIETRLAPNRGRDIAPKLIAFRDVYARYPLVLHLHSKKSPHDSVLRAWRYYLYETLMGGPEIVQSILSAFEQEPAIGMIAAQHYLPIKDGVIWGGNIATAQSLARRMGIDIHPGGLLDFPSGSMFWARSAALRPLLDLRLSPQDFPPELGQDDGTLAHAVERLYFLACEKAGFQWAKVARPALAHTQHDRVGPMEGPDDLRQYLADKAPLLKA